MKSKIEINPENGKKCLIVSYDSVRDDYNEAIEAAHKHHGIKRGQMTTIAMPEASVAVKSIADYFGSFAGVEFAEA
jgi:hypothetical protein